MLEKLKMNLQLFADSEDGEELESGGYAGEPDEDLEDEELDDEELDKETDEEELEDDDLEDDDNPVLDKKTKAIIKHKREAKELRKQLQEVQEQLQNNELEKEEAKRINELTKTGMSADDAAKTAKSESEVKKLRLKITNMELERLEDKYPGISMYTRELSDDKTKLPEFSYEQLYLANYSKQSEFDRKTKLEQEILYKNKAAKSKSLDSSNAKQKKSAKLSKEDERVFKYLKQSRPNLTRKEYLEILKSDTLD